MWRRWNHYNGNRGPTIGHPTLIETTVEEGYLETIPEVDSLKSKRSSGSTVLPELPFRAMPPLSTTSPQHTYPAWSQPSPTIPNYYVPPRETTHANDYYPEVSPPNSPLRLNPDMSMEETPISPLESEPSFRRSTHLLSHEYRSRIPRRVVSDKSTKPETEEREKEETKWDTYSGEPTKDETGRPSMARPGVQPLEQQYPLLERTRQILAGIREREALSRSEPSEPPPMDAPDPLDHVVRKEPWKGASGRTTLVDPVQNNPGARNGPLQYPQRNVSLAELPTHTERDASPARSLRSVASEESIKPVAPLKLTKSRNPSPQSSNGSLTPAIPNAAHSAPPIYQHPKSLQSPFTSPGPVRNTEMPTPLSIIRTDSPTDLAPATPRTPTPPISYHSTTPIKVQQMPEEPEISRFSWTTYSTSTTDSPTNITRIVVEEPTPPVPPIPQLHIRKRPVPGAHTQNPYTQNNTYPYPNPVVSRKPVVSKPRLSTGTITSQLSLSKTLPQIPPEVEATDKISNLEAQLNALAMRRYNTTRIIRDLNERLTKNAIVYDRWRRNDALDRIKNHEIELQSIANEEHDIGIRLHRALKKRDKEDNYETPTGLWIRRVTT